jgi:hypothetical protein
MLSTAKQIELSEFPYHLLYDLEKKYKDIRIPENPNFDIVITKEQIPTYTSLQAVCKSINESKQHLSGLVFGGIVTAYKGALNYDFKKQELEVNSSYFNGYYRRA